MPPACGVTSCGELRSAMPPQRQIGLVSATALVVANMVGSGVFTTSGFLLADLHSPLRVLAAWLTGGVIAMLGAVCYGALARRSGIGRRIHLSGSHSAPGRGLCGRLGFVAGWFCRTAGGDQPGVWRILEDLAARSSAARDRRDAATAALVRAWNSRSARRVDSHLCGAGEIVAHRRIAGIGWRGWMCSAAGGQGEFSIARLQSRLCGFLSATRAGMRQPMSVRKSASRSAICRGRWRWARDSSRCFISR